MYEKMDQLHQQSDSWEQKMLQVQKIVRIFQL